ncbi:hypothetical protein GCM10009853_098760 [Glycomyces scopariae]
MRQQVIAGKWPDGILLSRGKHHWSRRDGGWHLISPQIRNEHDYKTNNKARHKTDC